MYFDTNRWFHSRTWISTSIRSWRWNLINSMLLMAGSKKMASKLRSADKLLKIWQPRDLLDDKVSELRRVYSSYIVIKCPPSGLNKLDLQLAPFPMLFYLTNSVDCNSKCLSKLCLVIRLAEKGGSESYWSDLAYFLVEMILGRILGIIRCFLSLYWDWHSSKF